MQVDQVGEVQVVKIGRDYSGLNEALIRRTEQELIAVVDAASTPRIVLDMSATEYFGSTFLEVITHVWQRVTQRGGKLALCGVKPYCLEILHTSKLDTLWPIAGDAAEAAALVSSAG